MIDNRNQPMHVVIAIRHDHPPSLPHPPLTITRISRAGDGLFEPRALEQSPFGP
jgi:hypothetical protein